MKVDNWVFGTLNGKHSRMNKKTGIVQFATNTPVFYGENCIRPCNWENFHKSYWKDFKAPTITANTENY